MASNVVGRRKPYTAIGIRRLSCYRCELPAATQWQCCANGNRWLPLCRGCDVALNELALRFFRLPQGRKLIRQYRNRILKEGE